MNIHTVSCIYCGVGFNPSAGEGDHVLPRGFGDFKGSLIFRGACTTCNSMMSPLEEELLRTAPEAVYRRFAGAITSRRGEHAGWQGASGLPAPRFVILHEDHEELIDADPVVAGEGTPVDHLSVILKDDRKFHIELFPTMTVAALRRRFTRLGFDEDDIVRSYWHADEEYAEFYRVLLQELWPQRKHGDLPSTPKGTHRVRVRIECRFTERYYRAIAKIAFHYFLAQSKCGFTGLERCFAPIREFLTVGGDREQFFDSLVPDIRMPCGVLPDGSAVLPVRWMHMLCCFESALSVVVGVYTLFGPERPPSPHFVTLFQQASPCIVPVHRYGHAYIYGKAELGDKYAAFVEPLEIRVFG